jgi:hypothetical protein
VPATGVAALNLSKLQIQPFYAAIERRLARGNWLLTTNDGNAASRFVFDILINI